MSSERVIHIIHFNDVYNLHEKEKEPVGGAARFITAVESFKHLNPLVLFSGDMFSPSKLSQTMKGKQMLNFTDNFKIDVACVGNHDFDFGVDHFIKLKNQTNFPWLLTNVFDSKTNKPFGDTIDHVILEHEGIKIGIIGLAELEWLDSVTCIEDDDFIYECYYKSANKWCKQLREEGCELVIALTHMRLKNDQFLAQRVPDLDLILGGHDHFDREMNICDVFLLKSGTDFRQFSLVKVRLDCCPKTIKEEDDALVLNYKKSRIITREKVEVTKEFEPHKEMEEIVKFYWKDLEKQMEKISGYTGVDLDARFDKIRTQETNISNFCADALRFMTKSDVCVLNSGSLRIDDIIPEGYLKWKHLDALFPMQDEVVTVRILGEDLLQVLENGLAAVPKMDG